MAITPKSRIVFFTKGNVHVASSRFRAFYVAEELRKRGFDASVAEYDIGLISETNWPSKLKLIKSAAVSLFGGSAKILYLQRAINNKYFFLLSILSKFLRRNVIVFDFDDSIYLHSFLKAWVMTKLADLVVVGSHELESWARVRNKNTVLIPTSVPFEHYQNHNRMKRVKNETFTLGWVGVPSHAADSLPLLVPVLRELGRIRPGAYRFILLGSMYSQEVYKLFLDINGIDIKFIDSVEWADPEAVPRVIGEFDIGLMPLDDNEWNRGKCSFKAIEYMACGVPAIISPVGENIRLLDEGKGGVLAGGTVEWVTAIETLYGNREQLDRMGKEAEAIIWNRYSYNANIPRLIESLEKIMLPI